MTRTGTVRDFTLPDLGEGLEDAEIVEWHVSVGDTVALNQPLASVETAKAVVEVPSPFAGTVVETFGSAGETLAVGAVLVRIDTGADSDEAADVARPAEAPAARNGDQAEPKMLVGYGVQESSGSRRRRSPGTGRPLAKPPVRKLAKELGIDLATLMPGSGPGGIITREDVERTARPPAPVTGLPPVAADARPDEKAVPGFRGRRPGEVEQVRGIRKRIIEKLEHSRRDIPHALCSRDADLTQLWRLRDVLTAQAQADGSSVRISPMAVICRAVVTALRRFPTLNARYDQEAGEIRLLEPVHLGIAVDTERGLMVPNIKNAQSCTTLQIAEQTAQLAQRCRDGTATPQDLTGGTFTVDNYGWFGTDVGDPIINAPEAAILGIGTIRERPWVVDGELAVRRVATFTLAFDHRVCDGGEAGRFVTYLTELCEEPARILVHT